MPPTENPERILSNKVPICPNYDYKGPQHIINSEREPLHIFYQAFRSINCWDLLSSPTLRAQGAIGTVSPQIEFNPHICESIQGKVIQNVNRTYSKRLLRETQETAENNLFDLYKASIAKVGNKRKMPPTNSLRLYSWICLRNECRMKCLTAPAAAWSNPLLF